MGASNLTLYTKEKNRLAEILNAVSHSARLTVVEILREKHELRPIDIQLILGLSHAATNRHLKLMETRGVIRYSYETHFNLVSLEEDVLKVGGRFLMNEREEKVPKRRQKK